MEEDGRPVPDLTGGALDRRREGGHCWWRGFHGRAMSMNGLARLVLVAVMLVGVSAALSACGDTWRGLKEDTGENLERSGEAAEEAGEAVKP